MRRTIIVLCIGVLVGISQLNFTTSPSAVPESRAYILQELESIASVLNQMGAASTIQQKELYFQSREHYKHLEFFIEYYSPREAKFILNGPLVPKHDQENGKTIVQPQGFQLIEELLFSGDSFQTEEFTAQLALLINQFKKLAGYYSHCEITDAMLLEMSQLQLHRLASLTLNGYDATYTLTNVKEAEWSLVGVEKILSFFKKKVSGNNQAGTIHKEVLKGIRSSQRFLRANLDYSSFDRLGFITRCLDPLNDKLVDFHNASEIPWQNRPQAINLNRKHLFLGSSFNNRFFSMYYNDTLGLELQAQLGKLLFFDPILSGNNQRSCNSCHKTEMGFAEDLQASIRFDRLGALERNAPGLLNVMYQQAFFHDGRVGQLEEQALQVIHNKMELGSSLEAVVVKLTESEEYRSLFEKAFAAAKGPAITPYSIQKAISEYEKTLVSFNSRFDKFLAGDRLAINEREKSGYNIFAGKALCGSCHFFPLFNGTVPPFYTETEFEVVGTPKKSDNKELSSDLGRFKFTALEEHRNAIKTPTVRNVATTAPYMHNGAYSSLEQVVDFYHKGGGKGFGLEVNNQTLPFDSLQLSPRDKEDIVLFLHTLTDTASVGTAPVKLPSFGVDNRLNARRIGGVY